MKGSTNKNQESQTYDVKVTRAKETKEGQVVFDMVVNGVTIYGCWYREGVDKKGNDYQLISFPSHKGKDGKYYNHAYIKLTDDQTKEIISQIENML